MAARDVTIGTAARTASGGRLTVGAVRDAGSAGSPFRYVTAAVRACAPTTATARTRVDPTVFGLELRDGHMVRGDALTAPALRDDVIGPGTCRAGLVTFTIRDGQRPRAVVYLGASRVRWVVR